MKQKIDTNIEVIKSMPIEYTKAECNAFKHGWFLSKNYIKKEMRKINLPTGQVLWCVVL